MKFVMIRFIIPLPPLPFPISYQRTESEVGEGREEGSI